MARKKVYFHVSFNQNINSGQLYILMGYNYQQTTSKSWKKKPRLLLLVASKRIITCNSHRLLLLLISLLLQSKISDKPLLPFTTTMPVKIMRFRSEKTMLSPTLNLWARTGGKVLLPMARRWACSQQTTSNCNNTSSSFIHIHIHIHTCLSLSFFIFFRIYRCFPLSIYEFVYYDIKNKMREVRVSTNTIYIDRIFAKLSHGTNSRRYFKIWPCHLSKWPGVFRFYATWRSYSALLHQLQCRWRVLVS